MPALRVFQIGETRLLAVNEPKIIAAMHAISHIWPTVPNSPQKIAAVTKNLDAMFCDLAPLAVDPPVEDADADSAYDAGL